jgi:hypothetical protein
MTREELLKRTHEFLQRLPDEKLAEVHDFAEYLTSRREQYTLREGMTILSARSGSLSFLNDDREDIYTVSDIIAQNTLRA